MNNMSRRKKLKSIRIQLPTSVYYDALETCRVLHGAPSLSKYILNAAMTYSREFLEAKNDEIEARQAEADSLSTDSTEPESPEGLTDRDDFKNMILDILKTTDSGELADRLSTSVSTVERWARGDVAPADIGKKAIAKEFGYTKEFLQAKNDEIEARQARTEAEVEDDS